MDPRERQFQPGERVPGTEYVVIRLEAEGGHGALYLVRHHFLEKKVQMLKTLRGFEMNKDLVERLKREAQMLAAMDHPHIVSVTSGGLTDEKHPRPYFVMERLKGRSLAQILPDAPEGVGVDAALKVAIEVCDALEYVHVKHGIVHRDIKPDNIFLQITPRNSSVTKILDFGVAHMADLEKRYTKNNMFLGTPRYAAPEQIRGEKPTPATDLYAVGLLLYELLLGHGPFDDRNSLAALMTAHTKESVPAFPSDLRFPDGLEETVMSLLEKEPKDRPKSAAWLATQLRQIRREAEAEERADALSRTEVSPVQNALTGHRGELTEAGVPPEPASEPTAADSRLPTAPLAAQTASPVSITTVEPPLGYHPTVTPEGLGPGPAPTRSLVVDAPRAKPSSDTEALPVSPSAVWGAPADPGRTGPVSRNPEPIAQGGTSVTSGAGVVVLGHSSRPLVLGVVTGLIVVCVGGAFVLAGDRGGHDEPSRAPAASAPVAAVPPAQLPSPAPSLSASLAVAAAPPATATAVAPHDPSSATSPETTPTPPHRTAHPKAAAPDLPRTLPTSGL